MQKQIDNLLQSSSHIGVKFKRKHIKKEYRQQISDKQENECGECKQKLSAYFQIDHITAIQFGGSDDETNLMALCCECHVKNLSQKTNVGNEYEMQYKQY